jgi:hypothetical protein
MTLKYTLHHFFHVRTLVLMLALVSFSSCNEDDELVDGGDGGAVDEPAYFMQTTINGQTYMTNSVGFFGFGNQDGCEPVSYQLDNIGQIDIADYFFDAYLFHYENNEDFATVTPGISDVMQMYEYFSTPEAANSCNFRLVAGLVDKQLSDDETLLIPPGTHTVVSITQVSQNSTDVIYAVAGSFSCSFLNAAGEQIDVTGTYKIPVHCLL